MMVRTIDFHSTVLIPEHMLREAEDYTIEGSGELAVNLALFGYDSKNHPPIKVRSVGQNRYTVLDGCRRVSLMRAMNTGCILRGVPVKFADIDVQIVD